MGTHDTPTRAHALAQPREYSVSGSIGSRRLRFIYFGASALFGFVVGAAGLLVGMGLTDTPVRPSTSSLMALLPAAGITIAGAGIIAGAYQEAKRRRR